MAKDIQSIMWIVLGILFLINFIFMLYYGFNMRASIKPEKLMVSMFMPLWWLNTESLTNMGQQYRSKLLVHMLILGVMLLAALFLWAFGELSSNV